MELLINTTKIQMLAGELAKQVVDAIILPTNNYLWFSSGLSEDLKRRAGVDIEAKAEAVGPIQVGEAVVTDAGRLKSRFLIHTAAWGQDMMTNDRLIRMALSSALAIVRDKQLQTVAVPLAAFSVGGFPLVRAMEIAFYTILEHCMQRTSLERVLLVAANNPEIEILTRMFHSARAADPPKNEDNV